MKRKESKIYSAVLAVLLAMCLFLTACGARESEPAGGGGGNFSAVAGDYYLDLTELGMKLTVYLRLSEDGGFQFSNSPAFEANKSSGILQQGTGEYIMVYETVNGEEKKVSDGLTSSFSVKEDGSLDFSGCERIYYGSAAAVTSAEDNPDAKLIAVPLPDDYQAESTESVFPAGAYTAQEEGVAYRASFYEDGSYLLVEIREEGGVPQYSAETGSYGVSTTQLALTPSGLSRLSGEVLSGAELSIPMPAASGAERTAVSVKKQETAEVETVLTGQTGDGNKVPVTVTLYSDGTYSSDAGGFVEGGIFVMDSASGSFKIYPDHPETGLRGLNQISTVPSGSFSYQDGRLVLTDFRLRASESLSRVKCGLTQR